MNFNINYKYFLGPSGMIGVTTNNRSVSIWAKSLSLQQSTDRVIRPGEQAATK